MHVDDRYVYWTDPNSGVLRGPKVGGATEVIGPWDGGASGQLFASDDDYVYWLAQTGAFQKYSKSDGALQELTIGRYGVWASMTADETHLYAALHGCVGIAVVSKDGSSVEVRTVEPAEFLGSSTHIEVDATHIYCGNYDKIYRMPMGEGEAEVFVDGQDRVSGLAVDEDSLYWLDDHPPLPGSPTDLKAVAKSGGSPQILASIGGSSGGCVCLDTQRLTFYWLEAISYSSDVIAFEQELGVPRVLVEDRHTLQGFACDDDYVYWTEPYAIMRFPT